VRGDKPEEQPFDHKSPSLYRLLQQTMKERASAKKLLFSRRWRAFFCAALSVTLLYNPFFVASSSHVLPSVDHLPSYRADVASSELLKFKSNCEIAVQFVVESELPGLVLPTLSEGRTFLHVRSADERVDHQVFSTGNTWFRPPPVV